MVHFFRRKSALGLEISSSAVRLAMVSGRGRDISVSSVQTVSLPHGMVVESFTALNIIDERGLIDLIRRALSNLGHYPRKTSLGLPDTLFRVQMLELDSLPTKQSEQEQLIRWRLAKIAAFDQAEMLLRYQILDGDSKGVTVLACSAKRSIIEQYETLLRNLGLEAWNIGLSSFLAISLYEPFLPTDARSIFTHVSGNAFSTIVLEGGTVCFYRSKELKKGIQATVPERMVREIADSIHFYEHRERSPRKGSATLYLSGDSALAEALRTGLGTELTMPIDLLSPAQVLSRGSVHERLLPEHAGAIGAGRSV